MRSNKRIATLAQTLLVMFVHFRPITGETKADRRS